jgi:hypothetical protein
MAFDQTLPHTPCLLAPSQALERARLAPEGLRGERAALAPLMGAKPSHRLATAAFRQRSFAQRYLCNAGFGRGRVAMDEGDVDCLCCRPVVVPELPCATEQGAGVRQRRSGGALERRR